MASDLTPVCGGAGDPQPGGLIQSVLTPKEPAADSAAGAGAGAGADPAAADADKPVLARSRYGGPAWLPRPIRLLTGRVESVCEAAEARLTALSRHWAVRSPAP